MKKFGYPLFTLVMMLFIFWFSGKSGDESGEQSRFILTLLPWLPEIVIRKLAHFTLYFLLGWGMVHSVTGKHRILLAILLCFVYACSDEWHQTFVPERSGQFTDVLIDTAGSALACMTAARIKKGIARF